MDDAIAQTIATVVTLWSQEAYQTKGMFIADISPDNEGLERHLVILAARPLGEW